MDTTKPFRYEGLNIDIVIEDLKSDTRYNLIELEDQLGYEHKDESGKFNKTITYDNSYIYYGETKLKLDELTLEYIISEKQTVVMNIDFTKELLGVIEYLNQGIKKKVFANSVGEDPVIVNESI